MVTLVEELPFAAVVADDQLGLICSSCFESKNVQTLSRCIGCKVVRYCDKDCQKKDWANHKHECSFLKKCSPEIPVSTCRLIARIAMKLKRPDAKEPAFNGRAYEDLMDHCNEIKKDSERSKTLSAYSRVLCDFMGEKYVPDPALLMSIYGKVITNSFTIVGENGVSGEGIYLGLSVHDHSCIPDVHVLFDGIKATLRSPDPDKKYSKDLTVTYTELLRSNQARKEKLQSLYYFNCTCARCSDPTLDFLYNSARSACCPDSYCLLNPDAKEMSCNKCGSTSEIPAVLAVQINQQIRMVGKVFMERSAPDEQRLQMLIQAYEKFSKFLSPLNINLLVINDKLVRNALALFNSQVSNKYAEHLLPAYRRYMSVGDPELSEMLMTIAVARSYVNPPTRRVMEIFEEAYRASLASHGPKHRQTSGIDLLLSMYRTRLQRVTRI